MERKKRMPRLAAGGPAVLSKVPTSNWTANLIAEGVGDTDDSTDEQFADEEPE